MRDSIKARVSLKDTMDYFGIVIRGRKAICPFHNDKRPSMNIKDELWYCFVCGFGGDMFELVMRMHSIDFKEALKWFNERFNLGLTRQKYIPDPYLEALNENYVRLKKSFQKEYEDNCNKMYRMLSVKRRHWTAKMYTFELIYNDLMDYIEEKLKVLDDAKCERRSRNSIR